MSAEALNGRSVLRRMLRDAAVRPGFACKQAEAPVRVLAAGAPPGGLSQIGQAAPVPSQLWTNEDGAGRRQRLVGRS
jgi:hypothetical protein